MLRTCFLCGSAVAVICLVQPAIAQDGGNTSTQGQPTQETIVVTAERVRGQVETPAAPVVRLDQQQVASYGARSIADLVAQLAPQIGAGRGRGGFPLMLVNGQRVANFREIRRYPPEAIRLVEVLPEEVALKYGAQPDQRVINFVLKDNFASREVELEYGQPTAGGYRNAEVVASLLTIDGPRRTNVSLEWNNTSQLTEAERGVIQTPGSIPDVATDPDPARFRSLIARDASLEASATNTRTLGGPGSSTQLTLNGQWIHDVGHRLSGLDSVLLTAPDGSTALRTLDADPLERRTRSDTVSASSGLSSKFGGFDFQATVDATRATSHSDIDRRRDTSELVAAAAAGTLAIDGPLPTVPAGGIDTADNKTYTVDSIATLKGTLLRVPGGDVSLTLGTGYKLNGIDSTDSRSTAAAFSLDRRRLSGDFSLGVPITSRRRGFGAALGDISLDFGAGVDRLSDFGTLTDWNSGLTWKPARPLTFQATYVVRDVAPALTDLGAPNFVTFNVPYFDFTTGSTALVTQTSGGNPDLVAERQRDWKLSASLDLPFFDRANVLVEYYRNRSDNVTAPFPLLTPATEAAFPGRVARDAGGTLTAIDARLVTYAQTRSARLRYGFNLFGRLGTPNPQTQGGGPSGAMPRPPTRIAPEAPPQPPVNRTVGPSMSANQRVPSPGGVGPMDLQVFLAMQKGLHCAEPASEPDLSAVPPEIMDQLKGPDGQIDPARIAEFRERVCAIKPTDMLGPGGGEGAGDAIEGRGAASRGAPDAAPPPRSEGSSGPAAGGARTGQGAGQFAREKRWSLSLYHTINLTNTVLITPGGPLLDLLDGDAIGSGGGISRHSLELEGGMFLGGIGFRLSGQYNNATTVRGSGLPGSTDLHFGALATFNLRSFIGLDEQKWLVGDNSGILRNSRISLRVNNLFDAHRRVTDSAGVVPIAYQPALIDPVGRFAEVEFRKLF